MVGRDQYGYIKGPYYMVKPGPKPPGEHNKVESKKLHKLGGFPKLAAAPQGAPQAPREKHSYKYVPMPRAESGDGVPHAMGLPALGNGKREEWMLYLRAAAAALPALGPMG